MRASTNLSVLVTGGGSGIGRGTVEYLAKQGARVTVCGRREAPLQELVSSLGPTVHFEVADVTRPEDRDRLIEAAVAHGGGLHGLVSNAGSMYRCAIDDMEVAQLRAILDTTVVAGLMLTKAALPHLERTEGCVVFVGSAYTARAVPGVSAYSAAKGALDAAVRTLASELGPRRIRVNCIRPGGVFTELNTRTGLDEETARRRLQAISNWHALQRIGTATEVAEGIDYLLRADWVTGAILDVDGGLGLGHVHSS